VTTCRNVDVTQQILDHHRIYGASDSTAQSYTASSRSLNYANGATIQRPETERVSTIPRIMNYQDAVGLFGAENHFIKVNVLLQNPILGDYTINTYEPAGLSEEAQVNSDPYTFINAGYDTPGQAYIDYDADNNSDGSCGNTVCINTYEPAAFSGESLEGITSKFFKVELRNLKTGNIYVDSWLDTRLYNRYYEEHPYDIMYIKYNEPFYIGFHARNTRRLPYNIDCVIGQAAEGSPLPGFVEIEDVDPRYLATRR